MSSVFDNIPDIDFIEGISLEGTKNDMLQDYIDEYKSITGKEILLASAAPERLILNACALRVYQAFRYIDKMGKMNLTKYSEDGFLDNLGVLKNAERAKAKAATTVIRFNLSEPRITTTPIPLGTRVTGSMNLYFATTEYKEIPIGSLYVDVNAECLTVGKLGNDYKAGQIDSLVDISSCPYVKNAVNISTSVGGRDLEDNESFRESIYMAPAAYSVAGPSDAYKVRVKQCIDNIGDVRVESPEKGVVDIRFLMSDGSIPSAELIETVSQSISDKGVRPLTDKVQVSAPDIVNYNINLTYYINKSDANIAVDIQEAVSNAVNAYIRWQKSIGKDINPDKLNMLIMNAGAKRVVISAPIYTALDKGAVAVIGTNTVIYGGLEDD